LLTYKANIPTRKITKMDIPQIGFKMDKGWSYLLHQGFSLTLCTIYTWVLMMLLVTLKRKNSKKEDHNMGIPQIGFRMHMD
jgi:hypothetical protein